VQLFSYGYVDVKLMTNALVHGRETAIDYTARCSICVLYDRKWQRRVSLLAVAKPKTKYRSSVVVQGSTIGPHDDDNHVYKRHYSGMLGELATD